MPATAGHLDTTEAAAPRFPQLGNLGPQSSIFILGLSGEIGRSRG